MAANRKAAVRDMASVAHGLQSRVLEGVLGQATDGEWLVGETPISDLLRQLEGQEIVLIAASLNDERPLPIQICRTCGAEFQGAECPRCRDARTRLRGTGS
jgi:hypothetical protein